MEDYMKITHDPINIGEIVSHITHPEVGAVATFIGVVRGMDNGERISHLEYEAYPEMALNELGRIGAEARSRWPTIRQVAIVHRIGKLSVGEIAVVIGVCASHREEVFSAVHYAIDRLKEIAPIWKREVGEKGARWKSEV